MPGMTSNNEPLIKPEENLPEITLKVVLLSFVLTVVLCASNAYLGLKVGTTISASIPAAIIAMAVLRYFKSSNVLQTNIVQTTASVGEATAAGMAFIAPSLIITGYWKDFHFFSVFILTLLGGTLGVLFTIPLRRVMLQDKALRFPEGTAIGSVLKVSHGGSANLKPLVKGGLYGALIAFLQNGLQVISATYAFWAKKGGIVYGFGLGFSPALIAAGYIVGVNVAVSMLVGVLISYVVGIPVLSSLLNLPNHLSGVGAQQYLWESSLRYIGVGAMLVGGVWTILTLAKPIFDSLRVSLRGVFSASCHSDQAVLRTDKDIPILLTLLMVMVILVVMFFILFHYMTIEHISLFMEIAITTVATLFIFVFGFASASISAYFAGLVGSSNNPLSGLIVSCVLILSLLMLLFFNFSVRSSHAFKIELGAFVLMTCSLISAAISIANDSMQDLKAGQIVGATPWKQQVMLFVGVVIAALVIAPVLQLLYHAYGIGGVFPHAGMPQSEMLAAPQAGMMAAIVKGVFSHQLPWHMLFAGTVIAIIILLIDEWLKKNTEKRLPVLAVGLGIYLPLASSMPIVIGGFVSYLAHSRIIRRVGRRNSRQDEGAKKGLQKSLMIACGLVAGASVMGVVLAIPFSIAGNAEVLRVVPASFAPIADMLGVLVVVLLSHWLYKAATGYVNKDTR